MKLQPGANPEGGIALFIFHTYFVGPKPPRTIREAQLKAMASGHNFFVWAINGVGITSAASASIEGIPEAIERAHAEYVRAGLPPAMRIVVMPGKHGKAIRQVLRKAGRSEVTIQ